MKPFALILDDDVGHGARLSEAVAGHGFEVVVFDDLGHVPHEEDPVRTAKAVRAFLKTELSGF